MSHYLSGGSVVTGLSQGCGCDEDGIVTSHYASAGCVVTRVGLSREPWL